MQMDIDLLYRFENGLNPQQIQQSELPATVLGYGEISTIFSIQGDHGTAYKRMPLFMDRHSAEAYVLLYREYSHHLQEAGLRLPDHDAAIINIPGRPVVVYIDTSTPFLRKEGIEQLDPEPLLKSAPFFLRWLLRWLFLDDVINRYYDPRQVFMDIAANLYKEQRKDLIHEAIHIFNAYLTDGQKPLTAMDVEKYYQEDKRIWTLFLALRRLDCWITTKLLRKRYEFILPGKIDR